MDCRSRIKPNFAVDFRGIKIGRSHHQRVSRLGHLKPFVYKATTT